MIRRTAIAVVVVLLAAACTQMRGGGPGNEGLVVTVGVAGGLVAIGTLVAAVAMR